MIGLKARRQAAFQTNGVSELRDDPDLAGDRHEILIAHDLTDSGRHFRRDPGSDGRERFRCGLIG